MTDDKTMTIVHNGPEEVAFKLTLLALVSKGYTPQPIRGASNAPMKELLDIYAECIEAVRYPSDRLRPD
ncbi:hypothetical protein [Roseovarius ramblicola]|uniref:Uncharacterized protein n=1 Tax=Roseovarius ramblicola TaxID=2022336 RepID=A0ABV5I0T9_9RHOB